MNSKEFPKNSFEKFTGKMLVNKSKQTKDEATHNYAITATDRQYNIYLRDPLEVLIINRKMAGR